MAGTSKLSQAQRGIELYERDHTLLGDRTYAGLAKSVIEHAHNQLATTGSAYAAHTTAGNNTFTMEQAAAMINKAVREAIRGQAPAAAAAAPTTTRTKRSTNKPRGAATDDVPTHYCFVHGATFHPGSKCRQMLADTTKYPEAARNATERPTNPINNIYGADA